MMKILQQKTKILQQKMKILQQKMKILLLKKIMCGREPESDGRLEGKVSFIYK